MDFDAGPGQRLTLSSTAPLALGPSGAARARVGLEADQAVVLSLNWGDGAAPRLYLNAFHPEDDTLFLLGMVEASGLGWQGRYEQAELVALYLEGLGIFARSLDDFVGRQIEEIATPAARRPAP